MSAAARKTPRKTYRRARARRWRETTRTRTSANITAGTSKTMPIARMKIVTNSMYSAQRSCGVNTVPPKFTRKPRACGSSRK